jgi:hypothetical protein
MGINYPVFGLFTKLIEGQGFLHSVHCLLNLVKG